MATARNEHKRFQKDGPKRRRRTRRELPEGGFTQWMSVTNFKQEREARLLKIEDQEVKS